VVLFEAKLAFLLVMLAVFIEVVRAIQHGLMMPIQWRMRNVRHALHDPFRSISASRQRIALIADTFRVALAWRSGMDKLELDERLTRLERRFSFLLAMLFGVLLLIGAFGILQVLDRRVAAFPYPPQMAAPIRPPQPVDPPSHEAMKVQVRSTRSAAVQPPLGPSF
jgi:hypothetical protein